MVRAENAKKKRMDGQTNSHNKNGGMLTDRKSFSITKGWNQAIMRNVHNLTLELNNLHYWILKAQWLQKVWLHKCSQAHCSALTL